MSFEMNKIAGAVLMAMILAMVTGIIADSLVRPKPLAKPAYIVAGAEPQAKSESAAAGGAQAGPEPIGPLLATASAEDGKAAVKACAACHTFDKGGANRVGPNLYGIVGDEIAHDRGGFAFSAALSAKKGAWTPDTLNEWLWDPKAFAKGTKMSYAGMRSAKDRANVIAYLNSLSDNPQPLAAGK